MRLTDKQQEFLKQKDLVDAIKFCVEKLTSNKWTLEQYNFVLDWLKENHPVYLKVKNQPLTAEEIADLVNGKLL